MKLRIPIATTPEHCLECPAYQHCPSTRYQRAVGSFNELLDSGEKRFSEDSLRAIGEKLCADMGKLEADAKNVEFVRGQCEGPVTLVDGPEDGMQRTHDLIPRFGRTEIPVGFKMAQESVRSDGYIIESLSPKLALRLVDKDGHVTASVDNGVAVTITPAYKQPVTLAHESENKSPVLNVERYLSSVMLSELMY